MKKRLDLSGLWSGKAEGLDEFQVELPGTLDTNGIGHADEDNLEGRLTRLHTYEGVVTYSKMIALPICKRGRILLKVERTRDLSLRLDGKQVPIWEPGTLSTPFLFDVTAYSGQEVLLELIVDNAYHEWPRESIIGASAATDETQTNWNGVLGEFGIYEIEPMDVTSVRFYPSLYDANVLVELSGIGINEWKQGRTQIALASDCFEKKGDFQAEWKPVEEPSFFFKGEKRDRLVLKCEAIRLDSKVKYWDEGEGNLYTLTVTVSDECGVDGKKKILASSMTTVGVRTFGYNQSLRLTLNERPFFLRGEANCCVFPENGHPPVTVEEWEKVLAVYESYGVNCMRFHSWCPPEAAFIAADQMGMMMQPELSQWNFKDAFASETDRDYYHKEVYEILRWYGNHPSFVMLTFGNELQYTEAGYQDAQNLLKTVREYDSTRMYAHSSNYHYGEVGVDQESDFYTSMTYYEDILRATSSPMIGHLNESYPSAEHTYDAAVNKVLKCGKPVFGFEVGQYEILPEFSEIEAFQGITKARNYEIVKERVEEKGMLETWTKDVEATGEIALACYREEVEAALRTKQMSGLSLLGLQDFPGQGTALVGMLNTHLQAKPYAFAKSERFQAFFRSTLPLLYLPRYTFVEGEVLSANLELANYSKDDLCTSVECTLKNGNKVIWEYIFDKKSYVSGQNGVVGTVEIKLPHIISASQWDIEIKAKGTSNTYPIWIFPNRDLPEMQNFRVAKVYSDELLSEIENGAVIYMEPPVDKEHFPNSIGGHFTTDFWSVGTFPMQEGGMGMVIDVAHPALEQFPTRFYSQYQWWPMATGRPMVLPKQVNPIVRVPDSYSRLKHMGLLFAAKIGKGLLMVSSMGLLSKEFPECHGLLYSLFSYLNQADILENDDLCQMTKEEVRKIFVEPGQEVKDYA